LSALKSIPAPEPISEAKRAEEPVLSAADIAREVRRRRAGKLLRMVIGWVVVPTLLSAIYLYTVARDQYQSVATLIVHGNGASGVMVREYMLSRDMLAKLEQRTHFSEHYAQHGDPLFGLSTEAGSETRYGAFRSSVVVRHDPSSGVITLVVRAFSPSVAHAFAKTMVDEATKFMGSLSGDAGAAQLTQVARPSQANESDYPRRGYGVLTAFFVSFALFVIGSLLIMAVREHAQF
jgi:capsular polysaccharide transport system permease protein